MMVRALKRLMSVLVACRGLAHEAASEVDHCPISSLIRPVSYLEGLAVWKSLIGTDTL
jgi:hypothetical protein